MNHRILKKIRNFRAMSGLLITLLTLVSFQNCAPPQAACTGDAAKCAQEGSNSSSSTSGNNSNSAQGLWGNGSSGGGIAGGGGGGSSGSIGGSGGGSGGGGVTIGGGGGSGGGGSGGGGGGTETGSGGALSIMTQPANVSVTENQTFELTVQITGGKYPFTFQWYKDNQAISEGLGTYSTYADTANTYYKQGTYKVKITDGSGQSVTSLNARVTFVEPAVGCPAASYFTFTNKDYDIGTNYFTEYFDGPRGKFLLHESYDIYKLLYPNAKYTNLSAFNVPTTLAYKGNTWISCRTAIPRIHSPVKNPGWTSGSGSYNQYADGYNYKYQGSVEFQCRNKKLLFVKSTCAWKYYAPAPTGGGGGGSK